MYERLIDDGSKIYSACFLCQQHLCFPTSGSERRDEKCVCGSEMVEAMRRARVRSVCVVRAWWWYRR